MTDSLQAIDVHGHYGASRDQRWAQNNRFMTADAAEVVRRAARARLGLTVVSPLAGLAIRSPRAVYRANRDAARTVARFPALRQWAIVHPLAPETFDQAAELLAGPNCVGIKIHPEMHGYPICEHGRAIFAFAEEHRAVVLTHSAQQRSLPADFVCFANAFPRAKLILAHLGFGHDEKLTHQVRAIQRAKHGNVFVDTSSSRSLWPNLIEWAVGEVGAEHVLFGTDTPLYFVAMQRARIESADISARDRRRILRDNAAALLRISDHSAIGA